jgi:hypothetical protein
MVLRSTGAWRWPYLIAWALAVLALILAFALRMTAPDGEPAILEIQDVDGRVREISLVELKRLPGLTRRGSYQNQFGNWRDEGLYEGALLSALLGAGTAYRMVRVIASDGYRIDIERERVEDTAYPMVLAYARDGVELPAWEEGPRIAVLPPDGDVSNEEYGTDSAGSFWVKNVMQLVLLR